MNGVSAISLDHERFATPVEPGKWAAIGLSVFMHALLIGSLLMAVQWQTRHVPLQAELWREIPREPTPQPKAPEPPPKPVEKPTPPAPAPKPAVPEKAAPVVEPPKPRPPDIAVAKEKPKPAPKPKVVEKPRPPDFASELAAAEREIARHRETQEKAAAAEREAKALADARAEAAASARARAEAEYAQRIGNKIRSNIVLPPGVRGNPQARFDVVQLPDGVVLSVRLSRSSGQPALDLAIERAIMKSSPLPLPTLKELFRRELNIGYCPVEAAPCPG